jgi:hypothetical protein
MFNKKAEGSFTDRICMVQPVVTNWSYYYFFFKAKSMVSVYKKKQEPDEK